MLYNALMTNIALITGGAKRVGRDIALHLAQEGWNIALHYHRSDEEALQTRDEIEALGARCELFSANLTHANEVARLIPTIRELMGDISLLVNNASLFVRDELGSFTEETLNQHMQLHVHAPLQLIRDMAAQELGEGNVINLVDGMESTSVGAHFLTYSLSKKGLSEITTTLASELAPQIRINAIAMGLTLPDENFNAEAFERLAENIPLKRVSNPHEVCQTISFILNTPTITGQHIALNSGMHIKHR